MKKIVILGVIAATLCLSLTGCGGKVCDECGEKFSGAAYYDTFGYDQMCKDCAKEYWAPLDYREYKVR